MQNNGQTGEKRVIFKSRRSRVIAAVCALIVIAAIGPALVSESMTSLHAEEFSDTMIESFGENRKVISYSLNVARLYVWSDGSDPDEDCLGGVLRLTREYSETEETPWEIAGWEPYWSKDEGNDRVVWQYWWHFVYFLF